MKLVKVNYLLVFFFSFSIVLGQIPEKPKKIYPVVDDANLLTNNEEQLLNTKLINHFKNTSTEILIVTIKSLQGANENMVAAQIGEDWGIGEKEKDNGIVILVSEKEHKIAIQSGYGANIYLTATLAKQIISNNISPYFKQNNFYGGLDKGTDAIFQVLEGKYNDQPTQQEDIPVFPIILFIILFIILISLRNNGRGGNGDRHYKKSLGPIDIILTSSGRSSWGGSSGGFGGFGGGGSFGGGGASGGW
ncbi:MAG: TPM domain-containing protein [Flavobacteriales bacterium]